MNHVPAGLTRRAALAALLPSVAALSTAAKLKAMTLPVGNNDGWFPSVWTSAGWDTSRAKRITAGSNLQTALNNAQPGDVLLLEPGATWTGNFTLPDKSGDTPITIASAAWNSLPPVGDRISPTQAGYMPRIVAPNGAAALQANSRSHHWRLYGLHITSSVYNNGVLRLGDGTETAESDLPHHFDVVQCYVHPSTPNGGKRGIAVNGKHISVRDSYISGWKSDGQDTQAICGWACQYVYLINNFCEASGENIFFGEYSRIPNFWPSDIVVTKNYLFKPLAWRTELSPAGKKWVIKNLLELKSGIRVHIHGNVLENCWSQGQKGYAFNLKPGTEPGHPTTPPKTEDVTIERNLIRNVEMAANVTGVQPTGSGLGTCRNVIFRHNAFVDMRPAQWLIQHTTGPVDNVTWERNSFVAPAGWAGPLVYLPLVSGGYSSQLKFQGNLATFGSGVKADGRAAGVSSLAAAYGSAYTFTGNVLMNGSGVPATNHPAGNTYCASVMFAANGYSQSDHMNAGCDAGGVATATASVVTGKSAVSATTDAARTQSATTAATNTSSPLAVVKLVLINAETDQPISGYTQLTDGMTLKLSSLPTRKLNIQAVTNPYSTGCVKFDVIGGTNRVENDAPYALAGDTGGKYNAWTPRPGNLIITATPFSGRAARGTMGYSLTVRLYVVE